MPRQSTTLFSTRAVALAMIAAASVSVQRGVLAATTPWMLGEERAPACYSLTNQDIRMPAGLDMQWVLPPPPALDSTAPSDVEYTVTIDDSVFWSDPANMALLGPDLAHWRELCNASATPENTGCTTASNPQTRCCVWHSNVHSCLQSTGEACEPWIAPRNSTPAPTSNGSACGTSAPAATTSPQVLVTHTAAQIGVAGPYLQHLQLPADSWVIIGHVKIMNFQCAVGALRQSIEPPPAVAAASSSSGVAIGAAVGSTVAVLAAAAAIIGGRAAAARANARDVSNAPTGGPDTTTTIVFTDIQDSTQLWGHYTLSMAAALDTHHAVVREAIAAHKGYEVKTVGDAFMIACKTPQAAVAIARDIQVGLMQRGWARCITRHYDGELLEDVPELVEAPVAVGQEVVPKSPSAAWTGGSDSHTPKHAGATSGGEGDPAFHGVRVRIGIHTGTPDAVFDEVSKGYDYYGPDVNLAARTEATAVGGQILVTPNTLAAVEAELTELGVVVTGSSRCALKGIDGDMTLTAIEPTALPYPRNLPVHSKHNYNNNGASDAVNSPRLGESGLMNASFRSTESQRVFTATDKPADSVARRLHESLFTHRPLHEVLDLVESRMATIETLLKPLSEANKVKVLNVLGDGWRTRQQDTASRQHTIAALAARLIPAEKRHFPDQQAPPSTHSDKQEELLPVSSSTGRFLASPDAPRGSPTRVLPRPEYR